MDKRDTGTVDVHDNRANVIIGGSEFTLVASLLAERIYGDTFRSDPDQLGYSSSYTTVRVPVRDDEGNPVVDSQGNPVTKPERGLEISYTGRFKADVSVSAISRGVTLGDVPYQVYAAAWAMARAAGSTDMSWDEWRVWTENLPSNMDRDRALWEAVCVDLAERAIFRDESRPTDTGKPDEGETEEG
jgi:hypothetical protein